MYFSQSEPKKVCDCHSENQKKYGKLMKYAQNYVISAENET
jgi:hypothetical protein